MRGKEYLLKIRNKKILSFWDTILDYMHMKLLVRQHVIFAVSAGGKGGVLTR